MSSCLLPARVLWTKIKYCNLPHFIHNTLADLSLSSWNLKFTAYWHYSICNQINQYMLQTLITITVEHKYFFRCQNLFNLLFIQQCWWRCHYNRYIKLLINQTRQRILKVSKTDFRKIWKCWVSLSQLLLWLVSSLLSEITEAA